ncbi:hypothetical protein NDN08_005198 [Rhodosorus marinus]|uniref:Uncharacterized protein n=1 Tax=Rhodosorus marinus TaxID=101924 RepID=A0AAV8V175_9RHOD|nr:hypothetical protein NDN08_005198 [Rhodosorus marinus]
MRQPEEPNCQCLPCKLRAEGCELESVPGSWNGGLTESIVFQASSWISRLDRRSGLGRSCLSADELEHPDLLIHFSRGLEKICSLQNWIEVPNGGRTDREDLVHSSLYQLGSEHNLISSKK